MTGSIDGNATRDSRTALIVDRAGLHSLRAEWDRLHCGGAMFQGFDWAAAWWDAAAGERRLTPVILRVETAEGVCLAPLQVRRRGGLRRLEWLGMEVTDRCDLLVSDGAGPGIAAAVLAGLPGADFVALGHLAAGARARVMLEDARGLPVTEEGCPWLMLPGPVPGKGVRQAIRRLERLAPITLRRAETVAERAALVDFVVRHKRATLLRQAYPLRQFDAVIAPFLRLLPDASLPHGSSGLWLGDRMIAAQIGFEEAGTLLYYLPSYDAEFARWSPGRVLLSMLAVDAAGRGLRVLDLLRGREAYKEAWTSEVAPLARLRWTPTWRGRVVEGLRRLL